MSDDQKKLIYLLLVIAAVFGLFGALTADRLAAEQPTKKDVPTYEVTWEKIGENLWRSTPDKYGVSCYGNSSGRNSCVRVKE